MANFKDLNAFTIHHGMMKISGIWPQKKPTIFYKIRTSISWILSVGVTTTMCMEAINDYNDFTKVSEILYILITWSAYLIKLAAFNYNRELFWGMLDFLEDPVFMSYPDDVNHYMVNSIKCSTIFTKILRYLYMGCAFLYLIYPVLDNIPLPFPFPYDLGKYTFLMYAFQSAGEACAAWNNCCLDTLCWCLMGVGAAQLEILAEKIQRFAENEDLGTKSCEISEEMDMTAMTYLKQCVEHHLAIIKFIDLIERIFTLGLLAQFLASIICVCNTLFHFILISFSFQFVLLVVYFVAMLQQLFLYCWYGNEIILQSIKVGEACYMSNWHKHGTEVRKCLFIIMERSKKPLKITTLKFSTLSLAAFGAILQWSYSCLALLLKMYNKKSSE